MGVRFGGFFPPAPGGGMAAVTAAERQLRRPIDILMWFQAWGHDAEPERQAQWLAAVSPRSALITWEPWRPGRPAAQPAYSLAAIAAGEHDAYLAEWARVLRRHGDPVSLRPMHEMNGNWYPWCPAASGEGPSAYIAAWRHMHDVFARAGAANVRWVWSPNASDVPAGNYFESYYPGSGYVDVLGLSGFNWGNTQPWSRWQSFTEIFGDPYRRICALSAQPVWFTELACAPGARKARWVTEMLAAIPRFPRLEAVIWFNHVKETDWRATHPAGVAKSFAVADR